MSANSIHPTAVIGSDVDLGSGNIIGPFAVIEGPITIGDGNWFGPHCSVGTPAQWSGMRGPEMATMHRNGVQIGNDNVLREFVTVHQGTDRITTIGDRTYLMAYAHVPHDALVSSDTTITNATQLAGHTQIGWKANIGLGTVVHQRTVIGAYAMIGMQSVVTSDVPPGAVAFGSPARVRGVNRVGLQRAGFDGSEINAVEAALLAPEPNLSSIARLQEAWTWYTEKVATARPLEARRRPAAADQP